MSLDSSAQPLKDKSKPSITNRDTPLFTNRRPQRHPRTDFFTESLNSTQIPSPKPDANPPARPRQALNNGRALEAALRGPSQDDLDRRPLQAESSKQDWPRQRSQRRPIVDSSGRASPSPSAGYNKSFRGGTRTPSPPRGRRFDPLISPISDASASSPPRGLAEAYQRIEDEEDLAGLEGTAEEDSDTGENFIPPVDNNNFIQRLRESGSPVSRKNSARPSPRSSMATPPAELANQIVPEDQAHSSDGSSPFEEIPSGEGVGNPILSAHERDQQRVRNALSGRLPAFSKAFGRGRSGLTTDALQRQDTGSLSENSSLGAGSIGSNVSDPAPNVPREWGRKGRKNRDWLRGITGAGKPSSEVANVPEPAGKENIPIKDLPSAVVNRRTDAASRPPRDSPAEARIMPSIEISPEREPSSEAPNTANNDRIDEANRIIPSRRRNARLNALRHQEIQNLENRALTTNRLGELKEKRSLDRIGKQSVQSKSKEGENAAEGPSRGTNSSNERLDQPIKVENKGTAVPNSPVVVYDSKQYTGIEKDQAENRSSRSDPRDVLRQLSKATSPLQNTEVQTRQEVERRPSDEARHPPKQESLDRAQAAQQIPNENVESAKLNNIQETPLPKTILDRPNMNTYFKTPRVTGAWIDTPLPATAPNVKLGGLVEEDEESPAKGAISKQESAEPAEKPIAAKDTIQRVKSEETAPTMPTALSDILDRAKTKKRLGLPPESDDTLQLGDSTIDSLENMVINTDSENTQSIASGPPSSKKSRSPSRLPRFDAAKAINPPSPRTFSLTERLSRLKSSITDAKEGVGSIQKRLTSNVKSQRKASSTATAKNPQHECNEAGELHDFILHCEFCRSSGGSYDTKLDVGILDLQWQTVQFPMPRLWVWPARYSSPRLTRLGWCSLMCLALLVAEMIVRYAAIPAFIRSSLQYFMG